MKNLVKQGLVSYRSGAHDQVPAAADAAGNWYVSDLVTATNPVLVLPPIKSGTFKGSTDLITLVSVLEVTQIAIIADDNVTGTLETVQANTRYQVELTFLQENYEGGMKSSENYAYKSPYTLTGSASTDRSNMYTSLAARINQESKINYVTAYTLTALTFSSGATHALVVGDTLTASGTGTGTFIFAGYATGTTTGYASGTMYVYNQVGTYSTGDTLTGTSLSSSGTVVGGALVLAQGLVIVDTAGYYPARPNPRTGATGVFAGIGNGWQTAVPVIERTAVYSRGNGTRMLQDLPTFDLGNQNVVTGNADFNPTSNPVAGTYYTTFIIPVKTAPSPNGMTGFTEGNVVNYVLYAAETTQGTAPVALAAALAAIS